MTTATVIAGRYEIEARLGRGGMADVLSARELATGCPVAVKRGRGRALADELIAHEARVLGRLAHRGIVRAVELVVHAGAHHLVLEHIAGASLAQASVACVPRLVRQLAEALDHAHGRGIVHLDLKRENVMLDTSGRARLIDFGIAACAGEPGPAGGEDVLLGTPRAMAPEQITGCAVDHRADLFALGALLYELCSGASPFAAESPLATLDRVLDHAPPPVRAVAPALPPRLGDLIDHLLEKDPALRPQSAAEVLARVA